MIYLDHNATTPVAARVFEAMVPFLSFQDIDGESIVFGLDVQGICVSTGSACSTGEPEASHVLRAMGLSPRDAQGTIRVSLGRETREEDIDTTARASMETVARLRQISSVRGAAE